MTEYDPQDAVKRTITLSRAEAEELYRSYFKLHISFDDAELEQELERLNDKAKGGQGFDQYRILPGGVSR